MNIIDSLRNNAEKYPSKIGFIDEETKITFQEMLKCVEEFSSSELFKNKNEIVGLILENSIQDIIAYLGIINSGKIVHIIPPNITKKNLINQINSSNPDIIVCSEKNYEFVNSFNFFNNVFLYPNNIFKKLSLFTSLIKYDYILVTDGKKRSIYFSIFKFCKKKFLFTPSEGIKNLFKAVVEQN